MWVLWLRTEQQRVLITTVNPSYQKKEEPEGRQVVLWPQFQTEEGGILNNSKYYSTFCFNRHTPEVF